MSACKGSSSLSIQATLLPSQIHPWRLYLHGKRLLLIIAKVITRLWEGGVDGWNPAAVKHILTFTDTSNHGTWAQVSSPELNVVKSTDLHSLTVCCVGEQHSALTVSFHGK